jgi:phenylacetate-CoA ligase
MRLDFSTLPFKNRAFSEKPMTFIDQAPRNFLSAIIDLIAIETGNRAAREYWQSKQLQNLLRHAAQRSAFWRKRIGTRRIRDINLIDLPVLSRADVMHQVQNEGNLLPPSATLQATKHSTSGSSGTPVQFFVSDDNALFNQARSMAQYFMEGRDLTLNRTRFKSARNRMEGGFLAEDTGSWLGPLSALFRAGNNKDILHLQPDRNLLFRELRKAPIGYLVAQPRLIEALFYDSDVSFLSENGTEMFLAISEEAEKGLRAKFSAAGIPVRSSYSSEEVGYIGAECKNNPEAFHVVQSGVIVEVDSHDSVMVGGKRLGRVLVTHLHSYATPFVRYDIGDLATLSESCACGHEGPVLSNILGRKKRLLKRADGSVVPFLMKAEHILKIVKCDEYRIRQTDLNTIEVEIGGIDQLTVDQMASLKSTFKEHAGDEFQILINAVQNINWGGDIKRLGFRSELL